MNTEAMKTQIEALTAEGLLAEAAGHDGTPFFAAADALIDAVTALENRVNFIPAGTETYWG